MVGAFTITHSVAAIAERLGAKRCSLRIPTRPMLGFKAFHSADATLAGIETAHMIRKGQPEANERTAFKQFAALAA